MKEKLKAKLRTKSFWVALAGVAAMILGLFGVEDVSETLGRVVEAVGGLLVLTGIIASPAAEKAPDAGEKGEDLESAEENEESESADNSESGNIKD